MSRSKMQLPPLLPELSSAATMAIMAAQQRELYRCIVEIHKVLNKSLAPLIKGHSTKIISDQFFPSILEFAASHFDVAAREILEASLRQGTTPSSFGYHLSSLFSVTSYGLVPYRDAVGRQYLDRWGAHPDRRSDPPLFDDADKEADIQWCQDRLDGLVDYEQETRDWLRSRGPFCPLHSADEIVGSAWDTFNHPCYDTCKDAVRTLIRWLKEDPEGTLFFAITRRVHLQMIYWEAEAKTRWAEIVAALEPNLGSAAPEIGGQLEALRTEAGLTVDRLAGEAGCGERTIYEITSGKTRNPTERTR